MPTIYKPKKKTEYKKHGKAEQISKIYNSTKWVNLRKAYLMEHPLCEECEKNGIVRAATEVHHVYEISNGTTEIEMEDIALNPWKYDGLQALCEDCHHKKHGKH